MSPHYHEAEKRRQRILDFLNANPGASLRAITTQMVIDGDAYPQIANMIYTMIDWGEISFLGSGRIREYFPRATRTRNEAECIAARDVALARANEVRRQIKQAQADAQRCTGRVVHRPGKHPLPHQGGQGAQRERTYASGAQNY